MTLKLKGSRFYIKQQPTIVGFFLLGVVLSSRDHIIVKSPKFLTGMIVWAYVLPTPLKSISTFMVIVSHVTLGLIITPVCLVGIA